MGARTMARTGAGRAVRVVVTSALLLLLWAVMATHAAPAPARDARTRKEDEQAWIAWQAQVRAHPHADAAVLAKVASTLHALDALGATAWATDALGERVRRTVTGAGGMMSSSSSILQRRRRRVGTLAQSDTLIVVDLTVTAVTDALLAALEATGGEVVHASVIFRVVRAHLPLGTLATVAARADVVTVRPGSAPEVRRTTSEGVAAHNVTAVWALTAGVRSRETRIKVGIISNSATAGRIIALQGTGDLDDVYVVRGQEGNANDEEGAAMMEVVHDLAPDATLVFATATGAGLMADNIVKLAKAGCEVIVDDVGYPDASPLHDKGLISDAVNAVTGVVPMPGVPASPRLVYVSAAGNDGHTSTAPGASLPPPSKAWEGVFSELIEGGRSLHNWGDGSAYLEIKGTDSPGTVYLWWSDPMQGSSNDYDLILVNETHDTVCDSRDNQTGTQDPVEVVSLASPLNLGTTRYYLAVLRKPSALPRYLSVRIAGCDDCSIDTTSGAGSAGRMYGHPTTLGAVGVAAVNVPLHHGTAFSSVAGLQPEDYSSGGPRRLFYATDGRTLLSGGTDALTGYVLRASPVFAGATKVSTSTPDYQVFAGTSAAAPHVAALIALVKAAVSPQAYLTRTGIVALLQATAQRVGASDAQGYSPEGGWGLPNIEPVIRALQACPAGRFVNVSTVGPVPVLVCIPCPDGRDIPAGSGGSDVCTDPSTAPGATPPPPTSTPYPDVELTPYYATSAPTADPPPAGTAAAIAVPATLVGVGGMAVAGYYVVVRRRRQTHPAHDHIELKDSPTGDDDAASAKYSDPAPTGQPTAQ
jgi:hypothetical protein